MQNGRARNIRVDIEVDPQVLADAFNYLKRFLTAAEILLSSDLVMRQHDTCVGFAADPECLLKRFYDVVAFVTQVSGVESAGRAEQFSKPEDFACRCRFRGFIGEPGRHADHARVERFGQLIPHLIDLMVRRRALQIVHRADPQCGMTA